MCMKLNFPSVVLMIESFDVEGGSGSMLEVKCSALLHHCSSPIMAAFSLRQAENVSLAQKV